MESERSTRSDAGAASTGDDVFRVLVVAANEHVGEPLERELGERAQGRRHEARIVAPALTDTRFEHAAGAIDEARERAQERLEHSLEDAQEHAGDAKVQGMVGDSDPILAIDDALYGFPADEILVVTHEDEEAAWLEDNLFERARERFSIPISHFVLHGSRVEEEERAAPEEHISPDPELDTASENLPAPSARSLAGIVFAIVGTIALFVIAATHKDETASGFDIDAVHLMIAGAAALINLAHIVGLIFFESVGERGTVQRFFARASLFGTAGALVVSLLLTLV